MDYENILYVKDCTETDAGTYTVKASNSAGEVTQDITVKVAPKKEAPTIEAKTKDVKVEETDSVKLALTVKGESLLANHGK